MSKSVVVQTQTTKTNKKQIFLDGCLKSTEIRVLENMKEMNEKVSEEKGGEW